jgi:hypothetical protein
VSCGLKFCSDLGIQCPCYTDRHANLSRRNIVLVSLVNERVDAVMLKLHLARARTSKSDGRLYAFKQQVFLLAMQFKHNAEQIHNLHNCINLFRMLRYITWRESIGTSTLQHPGIARHRHRRRHRSIFTGNVSRELVIRSVFKTKSLIAVVRDTSATSCSFTCEPSRGLHQLHI